MLSRPAARYGWRTPLPIVVLAACLLLSAAPARADVRAFRTSDGSEDAAFVRLGAATTIERVVPDGARGAYLVGKLVVSGGQRQVVHILADGTVDPAFRPRIRGGRVLRAAAHGGSLAIAGTFTSAGGRARAGIAVLDARTGRPLAWTPVVPRRVASRTWGDIVFSGASLVVSAQHHVYAWRHGESRPAWAKLLYYGQLPAVLAGWRGALAVLAADPAAGTPALSRLDPATGAVRATGIDAEHVDSMQNVGGRLLGIVRGEVFAIGDDALSRRLATCGDVSEGSRVAVALAGDAHTLYAGMSPISLDAPGVVPGVVACSFADAAVGFNAPGYRYGVRGPIVHALALVGGHVLVFTQPF